MPKYKMKTTAQLSRTYVVDAPEIEVAVGMVDNDPDKYLVEEEEIDEMLDDISEVKPNG